MGSVFPRGHFLEIATEFGTDKQWMKEMGPFPSAKQFTSMMLCPPVCLLGCVWAITTENVGSLCVQQFVFFIHNRLGSKMGSPG